MAYLDDIESKRQSKVEDGKQRAVVDSLDTLGSNVRSLPEQINDALKDKPQDVTVKNIDFNKLADAIQSISKVTGPKGSKGDKGDKGNSGQPGKDGKNGNDGNDGYTPVKDLDYFDGVQGAQGLAGIDGQDGRDGQDGYTPIKGTDYFDGKKGAKGDKGDIGQPGRNGISADRYYLPMTTETVLGGIKLGSGLARDTDGVVSVTGSQPLDADLTTLAGLTPTNNDTLVYTTGAWANRTMAQFKTTAALNNVSNTSDANKPVSTAQAAADALKSNIAGPTFTGTVTIPILAVTNTNGTMSLTATTDGGDYNIFHGTGNNQTLAVYGSAGGVMNLDLLDGQLRLNGTARITNTGVFFPQQATTAAAPAYVKGGMYFDTTLNKMRIGGATAWESLTSV